MSTVRFKADKRPALSADGTADPFGELGAFVRHLRAENKSARTVETYSESVRQLHHFLTKNGMPTRPGDVARECTAWPPAQTAQRCGACPRRDSLAHSLRRTHD